MNKLKRFGNIVLYTICIALLIWLFASWADVVANNMDDAPQYHSWNIFERMSSNDDDGY